MSLYTLKFNSSDEPSDEHNDLFILSDNEIDENNLISEIPKPIVSENETSKPIINKNLSTSINIKPNDEILIPKKIEVPKPIIINYPIYLIQREQKIKFNGIRTFFRFNLLQQRYFSAKLKTRNTNYIPIVSGDEIHLSGPAEAVIITGNDGKDFSLRNKSHTGHEILTIRYFEISKSIRKMLITFFDRNENCPKTLKSRMVNNLPFLNFEGRYVIQSIKNAILFNEENGPNLLFLRKTGKNALEIEAKFDINPLFLFAIGISSFICSIM